MKIKKIVAYVLAIFLSVGTMAMQPICFGSGETVAKVETMTNDDKNTEGKINEQIEELREELNKQKIKIKELKAQKRESFLIEIGNAYLKLLKKAGLAIVAFASSAVLLSGTDKGNNFVNRIMTTTGLSDSRNPRKNEDYKLITNTVVSSIPALFTFIVA